MTTTSDLQMAFGFEQAAPTKGDVLIYLNEKGEHEPVIFVELFYRPGYTVVEDENGKQQVVMTGFLFV